jgi:hypothetical protein
MDAVIQEVVSDGNKSTKTNAERVATALNALLNQLTSLQIDCEIALFGYKVDGSGEINVGSRFGGPLVGRDFVRIEELAAAPMRVENRTRRIPAPSGFGKPREESVSFPIWYAPASGDKAPQVAAYDACRELITRWSEQHAGQGPAIVVHVQSGASGDGNPQMAVGKLFALSAPVGPPIVMQIHLGSTSQVVPASYPSNPQYLTVGSSRDLFQRASALPDDWLAALRQNKVAVNKGARAMLYNAKISDVIRAFGLIKTHLQSFAVDSGLSDDPPKSVGQVAAGEGPSDTSTAEASHPEKAALLIFVLDRSVADPFAGDIQNPCGKLQDHANDLLKQVSKLQDGRVEAAIVSYGIDSAGHVDIRTTFDGPLAGRTVVSQAELADGALRTDEVTEEVSNGVGGLVAVTRKKPIYFELEPTATAPPTDAFAAVGEIAAKWVEQHPTACVPPIVLHLTRGVVDPAAIEAAAARLQSVSTAAGPVVLYHLVSTEAPQKSLAYPDGEAQMDDPGLKQLWKVTSPLLDRAHLAAEKPCVKENSRGMVINGKFDLLLAGLKAALG